MHETACCNKICLCRWFPIKNSFDVHIIFVFAFFLNMIGHEIAFLLIHNVSSFKGKLQFENMFKEHSFLLEVKLESNFTLYV